MNRCLSSIIALSAASPGENLLFHLSAIFRFAPRCFQYCQGFVKILNICFHILAVVATTHQFQMGDSGFLQPVQCTKSTSTGTAQIVIPLRNTLFFFGLLPADSSIRDLLLSAGAASTVHDKDVQVRHSAENCRSFGKLAQFVQHKGFKLRPAPFFSCCFPGRDHGCHIFYRILSVKNHTFEIQILKGFQHFPVIFSRLPLRWI